MESTQQPLTLPEAATPSSPGWARVLFALERDALPLVIAVAFAAVVAEGLTSALNQDGWLALLSGREIVRHGLPTIDHLTAWSAGRRWTDQQWLGQLGIYGLYALGGLRLLLIVHGLIITATFGLAVAAARRLGGSPRSTALVAAAAFVPVFSTTSELRTQGAAALLFVLTAWLLICHARVPSRRVYLVFPLLALWANVHGSVLLGAGLCVLAGLSFAWEQLQLAPVSRLLGWRTRSLALVIGPAACIFASPYALTLAGYYHRTLFNPGFGKFVTEWRPTTFSGQNLPVYLLAGGGAWLIGRAGSRVSLFERLAFLVVAAAAFDATRNVGWLGLLSLLILPRAFGRTPALRTEGRVSPVAVGLIIASAVGVATFVAAAAGTPGPELGTRYPLRASQVVARSLAQDSKSRIFADERFADWLLWRLPQARGRVAYDARFELLSTQQVTRIYRWTAEVTDGWRAAAAGSSVAVVYRAHDPRKTAALQRSGARLLYSDPQIAVLALPKGFGRLAAP